MRLNFAGRDLGGLVMIRGIDDRSNNRRQFFDWTIDCFTVAFLAAFVNDERHSESQSGESFGQTLTQSGETPVDALGRLLDDMFRLFDEYDSFSALALKVLGDCPKEVADKVFAVQEYYSLGIDRITTQIGQITAGT